MSIAHDSYRIATYEVHDVCVFWFSRWKTSGCRSSALRDLQQYPLDELLRTSWRPGAATLVRINDTFQQRIMKQNRIKKHTQLNNSLHKIHENRVSFELNAVADPEIV